MTPDAEPVANTMDDEPNGDAGEFDELAGEHVEYLRGAAFRLSGDADAAKDLVQETLARALQHFAQFKQGTNIRAWLTTIVTRLFLDWVKHDKVVNKASRELATLGVVTIDIDLTSSAVSLALWRAIDALEPELREVVELRYFEEQSYKQIGDRLTLPVGTVGTRLKRAHERLKELLKSR